MSESEHASPNRREIATPTLGGEAVNILMQLRFGAEKENETKVAMNISPHSSSSMNKNLLQGRIEVFAEKTRCQTHAQPVQKKILVQNPAVRPVVTPRQIPQPSGNTSSAQEEGKQANPTGSTPYQLSPMPDSKLTSEQARNYRLQVPSISNTDTTSSVAFYESTGPVYVNKPTSSIRRRYIIEEHDGGRIIYELKYPPTQNRPTTAPNVRARPMNQKGYIPRPMTAPGPTVSQEKDSNGMQLCPKARLVRRIRNLPPLPSFQYDKSTSNTKGFETYGLRNKRRMRQWQQLAVPTEPLVNTNRTSLGSCGFFGGDRANSNAKALFASVQDNTLYSPPTKRIRASNPIVLPGVQNTMMQRNQGMRPQSTSRSSTSNLLPIAEKAHVSSPVGGVVDRCREKKESSKNNTRTYLKKGVEKKSGGWRCKECNKSFTASGSLTRHMLTHRDERPFPCTLCDRRFRQRAHLKKHIRLHTGEKPYSCPYCPWNFTQKSSLTGHIRTKHTFETPYGCEVCQRRFPTRNHLRAHKAKCNGRRGKREEAEDFGGRQKHSQVARMVGIVA